MIKEFVPYELAWELKHLGFDEPCFGYYHNLGSTQLVVSKRDLRADNNDGIEYCLAPLYQQAFRWFREKYDLYGEAKLTSVNLPNESDFAWYAYDVSGNDWEDNVFQETYEEAELACLQKLIEIVKNK
jgi:hypothetical protein